MAMEGLALLNQKQAANITGAEVVANNANIDEATWLTGRRAGLGGSDAAALLGVSPWASPWSLWRDKTDTHPPVSGDTRRFRAGHHLEPWILMEAMVEDRALEIRRAPYQLRSTTHAWQLGNVDGLATSVRRSGWGGAEAKVVHTHQARQWDDGVPAHYEAQVVHYFAVCPRLAWWVVAAYFGGDDLRLYEIERDDDLIAEVTERERQWWETHIVGGIEPPVDAHPATTEVLMEVEPSGKTLIVEGPELAAIEASFAELVDAEADLAVAKERVDLAKNQIRHLMGDAVVLEDAGGRKWATWKPGKGRTDWKAVAEAIAPEGVDLSVLAAQHTPTTRTLRVDAGRKHMKENAA